MTALKTEFPPEIAEMIPFCDDHSARFDLSNPYIKDGYVYATTGRIAARRKTSLDIPIQRDGTFPNMEPIFRLFDESKITEPLNFRLPHCEKCDDKRFVMSDGKCWVCNGKGYVKHECDCEHCHETTDCDECNGKGQFEPEKEACDCFGCYIEIEGLKAHASSFVALATLRDLRISKPIEGVFAGTVILFKSSNGIEGVMTLQA